MAPKLSPAFNACLSLLVLLFYSPVLILAVSQSAQAAPQRLNAEVYRDQLADTLERVGVMCILKQGTRQQLIVDSVRTGSAAFYKGLAAGDDIQTITARGGTLSILFLRGASQYQIRIPLTSEDALNGIYDLSAAVRGGSLKKQKAGLDKTKPKTVDITISGAPVTGVPGRKIPITDIGMTPQLQGGLQRLAQYNIELLIDRTGSMGLVDGTGNLSKFQWCRAQVLSLARALKPYQSKITITTFNTTYQTEENCGLDKVEQIYSTLTADGETDLLDPLVARLDAASAIWHRGAKRTLIAVITDGLPNVPTDTFKVDAAVRDYTLRMRDPNEVLITLLQIGDTFDGRDFCKRLDTKLVSEGARYDVVNTVTFDQLKTEGLVYALVNAILTNGAARK